MPRMFHSDPSPPFLPLDVHVFVRVAFSLLLSCFYEPMPTPNIKYHDQQQSDQGTENGGDERRPSKSPGPPSPAPRPARDRSPPSPPPPGTVANKWRPVASGNERRGYYYPAPGHQPAYPEQHRYYYDDRDDPFPKYTGPGARGMGRGEMSRGRTEGGRRRDDVRGEARVGGEGRDGRGLPPMWSRGGHHQWYSSSSRPGPRDPGGLLASASPAADSSGRIQEVEKVDGVRSGDPREPHYHHADRRSHGDREGGRRGRGTLPPPPSSPLRVPCGDRMPPPSIGRSGASVPVDGGVGDGVHNLYARPPSHDQEVLPSGGYRPSGAADHCLTPNHEGDTAPRFARPGASNHHTTSDAVDRIVQPRDSRRGGGTTSPAIVYGLPPADVAAAVPGAPRMERKGYRERRAEEARVLPPISKRFAAGKRYGGNIDEVMANPGRREELESIFPGLENEFRPMLGGFVEHTQLPPLYRKPEERNQHGVDRPYRREAKRLYPERELAGHGRNGGGKPEQPRYPPTRGHGYPDMGYYRHGRDRYFPQEDRYYREPREAYPPPRVGAYAEHGQDRGGDKDRGGSSAIFVRVKREGSEYPYPKYSAISRVRGEPGMKMANGRDGDFSRRSPTYPSRESDRSPEVLRSHPSPLPPSTTPIYQPPGRRRDHNKPPSGGTSPSQPRRPSDPTDIILPRRDWPLQQNTQSQPQQSQSQMPQRSESTAAHYHTSEPGDFHRDSSGIRDDLGDSGRSMFDRRLPLRSASPEDRAPSMRPVVVGLGEVTPIDGGQEPFCDVVRDSSGMTRLYIPKDPPVVPRRPSSKVNKRETLSDIAHRIPVSVMRPYFNYPLKKAAEAMNISLAMLKRLCHQHGVKSWPHRQISGINRAIAHLESQQDEAERRNGTGQLNTQVFKQMQELFRRRSMAIENAFKSDDGSRSQVTDRETYMAGETIEPRIAEGIRRSERLAGKRSTPHGRGDDEVIKKELGKPKDNRDVVEERRELRSLPRRGCEQEETQSLKHKQRGLPEETPPAKRQTLRSYPSKVEPPI